MATTAGPNEFLHAPSARKVTAVIANVLRDHAAAAAAGEL